MRASLEALWSVLWRIAAFVVVWALLLAPAVVPVVDDQGGFARSVPGRLYLEAVGLVSIVGGAWLLLRLADGRSLASLGLGRAGALTLLEGGFALGAALLLLAVAALWVLGNAQLADGATVAIVPLGGLALAVLFNSVTQEVLTRGYLLQTIEKGGGSIPAVVLSSLAFVALHAPALAGSWLAAANIFLAGTLLGLCYVAARTLWLPIGVHFGLNLLQGLVLGLSVSGQALDGGWQLVRLTGPAALTAGPFGPEGGVMTTAVTVIGIIVVWATRAHLGRAGSP